MRGYTRHEHGNLGSHIVTTRCAPPRVPRYSGEPQVMVEAPVTTVTHQNELRSQASQKFLINRSRFVPRPDGREPFLPVGHRGLHDTSRALAPAPTRSNAACDRAYSRRRRAGLELSPSPTRAPSRPLAPPSPSTPRGQVVGDKYNCHSIVPAKASRRGTE